MNLSFRSKLSALAVACMTLVSTQAVLAHSEHDHDMSAKSDSGATVKLLPSTDPKQGTATQFSLWVKDASGKTLTDPDLKAHHGEKVHVLLVDPSLADYQHIHADMGKDPGQYTFTVTPAKVGEYRVFVDVQPSSLEDEVYLPATFTVPGTPATVDKTLSKDAKVDGYTLKLDTGETGLSAGQDQSVVVTVSDAKGEPVHALEPILMAYAHAVAFNESASEVSHLHPVGAEPKNDADRGGADLEFHAHFATSGFKKIFVQVKIAGKTITAPFAIEVKDDDRKGKGEVTMGTSGDGKVVEMVNNKHCPISGDENGEMGEPLYIDYLGKRVSLCCTGCIKKYKSDPDTYLKKAMEDEKMEAAKK